MYLNFAWRYFRAKKSTHAINIIAWVTTGVIAFATCCQILVLSVFNGFEDLVKSLYSSFYADMKIVPANGKTFVLTPQKITELSSNTSVDYLSLIVEEKALIQNGESQTILQLKGVDHNYKYVCGISANIKKGKYDLGNAENPFLIVGAGLQNAAGISMNEALGPERLAVILPKTNNSSNDPLETLSEGIISPSGVFSIQQDFDNAYAITNIDFVKQQMGMRDNTFSAAEIKLKPAVNDKDTKAALTKILGDRFIIKNRYEQNSNLYNTMKTEKWAIYLVLTLILIIAAFNMISALSMLVLEKKQDIAILNSMGATFGQIRNIFLAEGLLLGIIGTVIGIILAATISLLQIHFKFIKIEGGSFLVDYFPVKAIATDYLLVTFTSLVIVVIASWIPSIKAARHKSTLA